MTDSSRDLTTASTSGSEMEALVAKLASLSRLGLDMTRLCIDVSDSLPRLIKAEVDAKVNAALGALPAAPATTFHRSLGPTPDEMDAAFPPGRGDNQEWHVVCVGRNPGLYSTSIEADAEVLGVPNQARKKKDNRAEALLYYRTQHGLGEVIKVSEVPPAAAARAARS
ncbi:hypothetical protein C8R47DRAFT_1207443 [Mycena vitilis]|nr:hypothetical protein C8R47DRAFT_1207443 [Mycena vitilis]